jgi:type I restriction enzyme S subunit
VNLNWTIVKIEDIAEVNPRLRKTDISDDLIVSFVPMPAVGAGDGSIDVSDLRPFGEVKKGFTKFQEGDVLLAKITPCMENGKMAIVPKVSNGYGFGSTEFHVLRPKEGVDARYLYYYVSSKEFRGVAERYMTGAVGQKRVSTTYLKEQEIPLAPYAQQTRIVAEIEKQFSRLDEAVANLKRVKANLKRYKAAVLKAAVEGKLTEEWRKKYVGAGFPRPECSLGSPRPGSSSGARLVGSPGHDQGRGDRAPTEPIETGAELLERILEERRANWQGRGKYKEPVAPDTSGLPALPVGWVWASLDQITSDSLIGLDRGRNQQNVEGVGIRYVKMNNVTMDGQILFDDLVYVQASYDEIKRFSLKSGDLLFNTRNSKELVGKVGLVRQITTDSIYNNNLMRIRFLRVSTRTLPAHRCAPMVSANGWSW